VKFYPEDGGDRFPLTESFNKGGKEREREQEI
jgi:hypothetical protein